MLVFDEPSPGEKRLRGQTTSKAILSDETLRVADPTFNPYSVWPFRAKFVDYDLVRFLQKDGEITVVVMLKSNDDPTLLPGWEPATR